LAHQKSALQGDFRLLKENGLEAQNPDQSSSMLAAFKEVIKTCQWKGFSEKDIRILFQTCTYSNWQIVAKEIDSI
jgi:hypothetical protein